MSRRTAKQKAFATTTFTLMAVGVVAWGFLSQREDKPEVAQVEEPPKEQILESELVDAPLEIEMIKEQPQAPVEPVVENVIKPPTEKLTPVPEVVTRVPKSEPPAPKPPAPKPEPPKSLENRMLIGSKAADEKLLLKDLDDIIKSGQWKAYRDQLESSVNESMANLPDDIRSDKLQALMGEPAFYGTLLRWKMLKMFPPGL